jgi:hypothetical protein
VVGVVAVGRWRACEEEEKEKYTGEGGKEGGGGGITLCFAERVGQYETKTRKGKHPNNISSRAHQAAGAGGGLQEEVEAWGLQGLQGLQGRGVSCQRPQPAEQSAGDHPGQMPWSCQGRQWLSLQLRGLQRNNGRGCHGA